MKKIVEKIANDGMVEKIIKNIAINTNDEDLVDFSQDVYMTLLEKDQDWLEGIYERGQMNYFITRIVLNNINSKTSRFYYLYKKNKSVTTPIDESNAEKGERADYD